MKTRILAGSVLALFVSAGAMAADLTAQQNVTVTVDKVMALTLSKTDEAITLGALEGTTGNFSTASPAAPTTMNWSTNLDSTDIQVNLDSAVTDGPTLQVAAASSDATPAGPVTLSVTATPLLTDVNSAGAADLTYTASGSTAIDPGDYVFNVVYTLLDNSII